MVLPDTPKVTTIPLGVIVVRDEPGESWPSDRWRAQSVFLDQAGSVPSVFRSRRNGTLHVARVPLLIDCRRSTEYRCNLANGVPSIYVVLRDEPRMPHPQRQGVEVRLVSVSPFEVQPYRDNGTLIVDRVPMPSALVDLVQQAILPDATPTKQKSGLTGEPPHREMPARDALDSNLCIRR